jgi:hypothetical protein
VQRPAAQEEEWALPASELVEAEALEALTLSCLLLRMRRILLPLLVLLGWPLLLLLLLRMLISGTSVAARRRWSHLPLLILNLPALLLGVESSINQLVEVAEAMV